MAEERSVQVRDWVAEAKALYRSVVRSFRPKKGPDGPDAVRRTKTRRGRDRKADQPLEKRLVEAYVARSYRHLGHRLDKVPDRHLDDRLRQADIRMSAGMFRAVSYISSFLVVIVAALVTLPLFLATAGFLGAAPLALAIGAATGVTTLLAFRMALTSRIQSRKTALEKEIAFTLSELGVLASIGLSPIEIMRRMAGRPHDPAMTREFRKIVYKADIQGKDVITALAETAKECPSEILRETLWDIGNMIHQGSDLGDYLEGQSGDMFDFKRARQKEFIDQLTTYSDMYVTIVLIGIIFVGIAAFVMDAFGMGAGGLSAGAVLQVLTYGAIPFVILVISILLSTAHGQVD